MLYMHFITSSKMKYSEIKKHLFINYGSIVDQTGISKLKLILKNILDNKYVPCFN